MLLLFTVLIQITLATSIKEEEVAGYFTKCTNRKPIIILPGLMSSIIESKVNVDESYQPWVSKCDRTKDWFRTWVNINAGMPWSDDCYLSYLEGVWNNKTNKLENIPGIEHRTPRFGSTYGVDQLYPEFLVGYASNAFHVLIKYLERKGYKDQYDLFGAPYDWRSNDLPKEYFEATKNLIIQGYKNTGRKAVLVSHSMGGFVTYKLLDFLGKEFCDKYIDRWVALSAPFTGSALAFKQIVVGGILGLNLKISWTEAAQKLVRSLQSTLSLSPNEDKWVNEPVASVKSTGKNYYAKDLREIYKQLDEVKDKVDYVIENSINAYYKKWNYAVPNGVQMYCAYSKGNETPYKIEFETEDLTKNYNVIFSDGDLAVNLNSLQSCSMFTDKVKDLGKFNHLQILSTSELQNYIQPMVCDL